MCAIQAGVLLIVLLRCVVAEPHDDSVTIPQLIIVEKHFKEATRSQYTILAQHKTVWSVLNKNGQQEQSDYVQPYNRYGYSYSEKEVNTYYNFTIKYSKLNIIPNNIFNYFNYIVKFNASFLDITSIQNTNFKSLYESYLNILDLSHNKIDRVPSNVFMFAKQLEIIDLSDNLIKFIDIDAFGNKSQVSYDSLGRPKTTINSKTVKIIYLHNNRLVDISEHIFFINGLTTLTLHDNLIESIEVNAFIDYQQNKMKVLDDLQIHNNYNLATVPIVTPHKIQLSNTSIDNLIVYSNVTLTIVAEHCKITNITVQNHNHEFQLKNLYLGYNYLTNVSNLSIFRNLEMLDISFNHLERIDGNAFNNFVHIHTLDISHNKLIEIDLQFLPIAVELLHLNISYNLLQTFHLDHQTNSLRMLQIDGNELTTIDTNIKQLAPSLTYLGLNDNNFTCQHLTVSLLLLHYDGISPTKSVAINETEEESGVWSRVKGIRCQVPIENYDEVISSTNAPDCNSRGEVDTSITYKELEQSVINNLNSKWDNLQENTTEALNYQIQLFQKSLNLLSFQIKELAGKLNETAEEI